MVVHSNLDYERKHFEIYALLSDTLCRILMWERRLHCEISRFRWILPSPLLTILFVDHLPRFHSVTRASFTQMMTSRNNYAQSPKYDLRVNPIYQVDWQNEASGKRVSATKRRVRWRFGFSNRAALDQGLKGPEARGEEHEVVLVWSLTSGKRLVVVDGQEVHFSMGRRADAKFETSWSMFGGHIFQIIAHAAAPLFNEHVFRQFDLIVDGMSFHSFPKIFQLGANNSVRRDRDAHPPRQHAPPSFATPTSREQDNQRAAPVTPETVKRPITKPVCEDLLSGPAERKDLLWDSAPQLTYQYRPQSSPQQQQYKAHQPLPQQELAAQSQPQYHYEQTSPRGVVDEFAPVPPQPRTFQDVSKEILSAYTPDPSIPALTYMPHYSEQAYQSSSGGAVQEEPPKTVTPDKQPKAVLKPTMEPISIVEMEERNEAPLSAMEKAVKALVNLEDITETLETPEHAKALRRKDQNQPPRSKPLPPATPEWHLGLRPALTDIQHHSQPKAAPKKEIMRTHAFDPAAAQAGMMVLYGSSFIPASSGFGAGIHQSQYYNSGYHMQQRMHTAY